MGCGVCFRMVGCGVCFRVVVIKDTFLPFMDITWVSENSMVAAVSYCPSSFYCAPPLMAGACADFPAITGP